MRARFLISIILISLTVGAIIFRKYRDNIEDRISRIHRHGVAKVLSYHSDDGKDSIVTTTIQDTFRIK